MVGYEPETKKFGIYRRVQTHDCHHSSNCGKVAGTLKWYLKEIGIMEHTKEVQISYDFLDK